MTNKLKCSFSAGFFATCRCHTCWKKTSQLASLPPADDIHAEQNFSASFFATCRCHICWKKASQLAVVSFAAGHKLAQLSVTMITLRAETWQFCGRAAGGHCQKEHACSASVHAAQTGSFPGLTLMTLLNKWQTNTLYSNKQLEGYSHLFDKSIEWVNGFMMAKQAAAVPFILAEMMGNWPLILIDMNHYHAVNRVWYIETNSDGCHPRRPESIWTLSDSIEYE